MRKKIREFEAVVYLYLGLIYDFVVTKDCAFLDSASEILEYMKSKHTPSIPIDIYEEDVLACYFFDIIDEMEDYILHLDMEARRVFLSQCTRFLYLETYKDMKETDKKNDIIRTLNGDHQMAIGLIGDYFSTIRMYIIDFGLKDILNNIPEDRYNILMSLPDPTYINGKLIELRDETKGYKTLPSTYRRAAVMALIDKSGLCKNIDKTKKAEFVEAVVGGNINAKPKDTVSYKTPTKEAQNEAKKLLETIGIYI